MCVNYRDRFVFLSAEFEGGKSHAEFQENEAKENLK